MTLDPKTLRWVRPGLALASLGAIGLAYLVFSDFRAGVDRAALLLARGDVEALRDYILSFGAAAPCVSALLMILQALIAPIPAFLLAFANGLAFGAFWGGLLTLGSASAAAALCFWLSRALGREAVQALVGRRWLVTADRWFDRWGGRAILLARLVPVVSFDVISYAAGLMPVRFSKFLAATVAGAAPATFLYSYLGERAPQYIWVLFLAFGIVIGGGLLTEFVRRRSSPRYKA